MSNSNSTSSNKNTKSHAAIFSQNTQHFADPDGFYAMKAQK